MYNVVNGFVHDIVVKKLGLHRVAAKLVPELVRSEFHAKKGPR